MKMLIILFLLIFFSACGTTETVIQDRKVEIEVPAIKDSIPAVAINVPPVVLDTLNAIFLSLPDSARFEGAKEVITSKGDKVKVHVAYMPKTNSFLIDIPSYKVDSTITDTTKIVIKKETFFEKFKFFAYALFFVAIIYLFIVWRKS